MVPSSRFDVLSESIPFNSSAADIQIMSKGDFKDPRRQHVTQIRHDVNFAMSGWSDDGGDLGKEWREGLIWRSKKLRGLRGYGSTWPAGGVHLLAEVKCSDCGPYHADGPEGHEAVAAVGVAPGIPARILSLLQDEHLPTEVSLLKGDKAGEGGPPDTGGAQGDPMPGSPVLVALLEAAGAGAPLSLASVPWLEADLAV
ncbi:hypothetical protein INR49_010383 [Caranx melampygus]|nr:hypothetical protein INR49_010383 [Caranx melampygus]